MLTKDLKLGLALSGGGIRALIFHLGVFEFLAKHELLEKVTHISSVSGASMFVGLLYAKNSNAFPSSKQYINEVLPSIKEQILSVNLENKAIFKTLLSLGLNKKANTIASALKEYWGIKTNFKDLPKTPKLSIQCTSYQTGKRFIFSQDEIGDYAFGFVKDFDFALADAVAASAAFPFLIGTFELDTSKFSWCDEKGQNIEPKSKLLYLWDGGVYDNLGLEPIYQIENNGTLSQEVNFTIVSNAGASIKFKDKSKLDLSRIADITSDQIAIIRLRAFREFCKNHQNGFHLKIGRPFSEVVQKLKADQSLVSRYEKYFLNKEACQKVGLYPTTLKSPSKEDFELILRQGYESMIYTQLCCPYIEDLKLEL
ncbi:patatin [Campylobacter sp. MIT 12-5580]|uniref:patatin-like phospholipase family protein n=1 Tax=Campylobacter sp. MIT 12-5580 TaxID=2040651 RepID=UPI0010F57245|nr:patatin-like phospholipase family protein [Campylobacter sp. MIT 12-5580]TKX28739.1 patatin [Campylobacter sp. MIT 12-5580]